MSVTALLDRAAITDLITGLGRLLDESRFEDVHLVFDTSAVLPGPRGTFTGLSEIRAFFEAGADPAVRTQHLYTDVLIDVEGDQATASANAVTAFFPAGLPGPAPAHRLVGLTSRFAARRGPEGWRLTRVEVTPLWQQPAP